ncbi:hypothetical protein L7F22_006238 [Adiantum nelumboides]|nr:hypothetical protein [Adiantum nelumboides]
MEGAEPCRCNGHIVIMVDLQGTGKITPAAKFALYSHKEWQHRPTSLGCEDSKGASAVYQLKQNAPKLGFPCFGSYLETQIPSRLFKQECAYLAKMRGLLTAISVLSWTPGSGTGKIRGCANWTTRRTPISTHSSWTLASAPKQRPGMHLRIKRNVTTGAVIVTN